MKYTKLILSAALIFLCGQAVASEYITRELMGNTLPPQKCSSRTEAEQRASDAYNIDKFAKRFCETQGYGWYVSEQKSPGKVSCEPCPSSSGADTFKCHREDLAVSCKRLKPGSAGLFPGKS